MKGEKETGRRRNTKQYEEIEKDREGQREREKEKPYKHELYGIRLDDEINT